ncbi:MAG: ABC transporter ATP-binding protein [Bdellovibrionia bacterium]
MSLILENITKSFSQGEHKVEVLKGVSAQVQTGETVAILGKSGSGKSTLLSVLAGLTPSDSGKYFLEGSALQGLSESEWSDFRGKNIAVVFQQYHLITHLTALENVMLPLEIQGKAEGAEVKAQKILEDLGLGHRLHHFPKQLSGGESQRVAIARALITEPKLLLADEPSGNLDSQTGDSVMKLFFDVVKKNKITTLLVTHNDDLAKNCDRILRLVEGRFSEV